MSVKIMHDPGHGGVDSGALGNGLLEKDLTLKISIYFGGILNEYKNVEVKATRSSDTFISLSDRAAMANNWGADYFVSFHINSFDGKTSGFESYIYKGLPQNGVTSNYQRIMNEEILKSNKLINRGFKQADFAVLRETSMPAILTENGFIDFEEDAAKLKNDSYLYTIAEAHAIGVARIFNLTKFVSENKSL
jgi:N-acetylmuramoyl-L-alanine amidase